MIKSCIRKRSKDKKLKNSKKNVKNLNKVRLISVQQRLLDPNRKINYFNFVYFFDYNFFYLEK